MTLTEFLTQEGLTLAAFGGRIGRSAATVSRIARGVNRPDWETMRAIEEITGGKVRPNDFREEPTPPKRKRPANGEEAMR